MEVSSYGTVMYHCQTLCLVFHKPGLFVVCYSDCILDVNPLGAEATVCKCGIQLCGLN